VKIWFQNRRSKTKKQNKQPDADSSSSSVYPMVVGSQSGADKATLHTDRAGAVAYRKADDDDDDDDDGGGGEVRRMFPPDSSIVYRRHEPHASATTPARPCSVNHRGRHEARVASEPEAGQRCSGATPTQHVMPSYDVDVRRHRHDLLSAQQLVLPSLQLLSGFQHAPAAAAAGSESSPWLASVPAPPPARAAAAVQQVSINEDRDAADSSSYLPWYSMHHLMDSYNQS